MRNLMCIVPACLEELQRKGVADHILQRDLGGYWDKVITVHPFCVRRQRIELTSNHTVLEYCLGDPFILADLYRVIRRNKVEVIKAHDPYYTGVLAYLLSRLSRTPYIIMICSSYTLMAKQYNRGQLRYIWLDRLVGRFTMSRAEVVFGGSEDARLWAAASGARRTELVRTGGVAVEHFTEPESREAWEVEGKVVLFVGRLDPIKYPEDALDAFSKIRTACPDSTMLVVGSGPQQEGLQVKYKDGVEFLGFIESPSTLARLMTRADVALVPLGGSVLVELALAGTPIVAYDIDWHRELIRDGAGVLVPFRDTNSMAEAAIGLLTDSGSAAELGRNARRVALSQHSLEAVQQCEAICMSNVRRAS